MLSILIPIYNWDCRTLVLSLKEQSDSCLTSYEIVCMDDGSRLQYREANQNLAKEKNVTYIELHRNIGRAAIRNKLAQYAKFKNLLFIDCDSTVVRSDYIENYIKASKEFQVIYGGTSYQDVLDNVNHSLRWNYGRARESKSTSERQKYANLHFMTNNFLIKKGIFEKVTFDESINGYGYEDSVFARDLETLGITIHHIDNPLQHDGLEPNADYLNKLKVAMHNLAQLKSEEKVNTSRLISAAEKLEKLQLSNIFLWIFEKSQNRIVKNLNSKNPNLKLLDIWKLYHFIKECQDLKTLNR